MAIGLGKMFGFDFMQNFDYPYISKSITEFWRRWHISLSSAGSRSMYISRLAAIKFTTAKAIRNLIIVWGLTGLWHGAAWNFIFWGFIMGSLIIEKYRSQRSVGTSPERGAAYVYDRACYVWLGAVFLTVARKRRRLYGNHAWNRGAGFADAPDFII